MKAGKLSEAVLKRSVLGQFHRMAIQVQGLEVGHDCSVIEPPQGELLVHAVSTMPLGSAVQGEGVKPEDMGMVPLLEELTVYNALNNIACSGAQPIGILVNLLLPTSANEQLLRDMTGRIERVCEREDIAVLGGHTEVVRSVTEPVLTVTAVGAVAKSDCVVPGRIRPGMDIVMTKWAGLMGTAILAKRFSEALCTRYARPFIEEAQVFEVYRSIRTEAAAAVSSGAAAMHDLSEGGVYGALWEMGLSSGVGLDIDLKSIPIRQETVEVCEFFDVNPYKLLSTGSLLIAAEDGRAVVEAMRQAGVEAAVIGRATDTNDRVLVYEEERRFLEHTQTDELWRILGNAGK